MTITLDAVVKNGKIELSMPPEMEDGEIVTVTIKLQSLPTIKLQSLPTIKLQSLPTIEPQSLETPSEKKSWMDVALGIAESGVMGDLPPDYARRAKGYKYRGGINYSFGSVIPAKAGIHIS